MASVLKQEQDQGRSPEGRQRILILGSGQFASEVADLIAEIPGREVAAMVDSHDRTKAGSLVDGIEVMWIDDIHPLADTHLAVCALGTTHREGFIQRVRDIGFRFDTVLHPSAQCSKAIEWGQGVIVSRCAAIAAHVRLGDYVIVNRGCLIGHHVDIGACSTLSPGANIAGGSRLGRGVYVGMGAIILNGVSIGDHAVVGAGAVVTHDVPDHVQVIGIPARITKTEIEGL